MEVAVTGIGLVSPLGNTPAAALAAAIAGRSAVRRLDTPEAARLAAPVAATAVLDGSIAFEPQKLRQLDRIGLFALHAARDALADAGLAPGDVDPQRAGVFFGTGMGGTGAVDDSYRALYGDRTDRVKPFAVLMGMYHAPAAWIGIETGFRGPNLTYSTACASSAVALGEAWRRIASGELDVAIAGGAEAPLTLGPLKAWEALHALAPMDERDPSASCRPFSRNRRGLVLAEGAALLVLERQDRAAARGARSHGRILGFGLSNDATHLTRPSVEGQAAALQAALASAGIAPQAVDAINAHGTGTVANDAAETAAIRLVFGGHAGRLPVSATKAVHGHLLGAAGALECVLSLLAMSGRVLLPTMNLDEPDPACDLDYVAGCAREGVDVRIMLSSSFAFGGCNAVLALGAA